MNSHDDKSHDDKYHDDKSHDDKSLTRNCFICNKHSIYNMECRCKQLLCKKHWAPEKHNCKFDFSHHANIQNTKQLVKIEHEKIAQI